jgi:DNA (cytosine-5)-methyltransferase 1
MTAIDLFAGAGGFSEGAKAAGVRVAWAANHWQAAVDCHAENHPGTAHACQDLQQADWGTVPRHDLLLASPACQGHSRARGTDRPHHDACRSTAWAVVSCAEVHRPPFLVVENVPEFSEWLLFPAWSEALRVLGYALSAQVLDAAAFGVPQNRRRLFIVGVQAKAPRWLRVPLRAPVAAEEIIDPSVGGWSPVAEKCAATRARVAAGRERFGRRFLIPYYSSGSGLTGRSLERPLGTVTTRDRYALIEGDSMRMLSVSEYRGAMGFPDSYRLPAASTLAKHLLGNAVCPPVAAEIIRQLAA